MMWFLPIYHNPRCGVEMRSPAVRRVGWVWLLMATMGLVGRASAQAGATDGDSTEGAPAAWTLIVDGTPAPWPLDGGYPADSLHGAARAVLRALQEEGYYLARLDSARVDTTRRPPAVRLYATRGPQVKLSEVRLLGATALPEAALRRRMYTRPGRVLDAARLEADLASLLALYGEAGYPLARVSVEALDLHDGPPPSLSLTLRIEEGGALPLTRIEVVGAERTTPSFVARVTGLHPGRPLAGYDPDAVRRRLQATAFFREVGEPVLLLEPGAGAVLRIPLEEEPPGSFDLVLGYQPPSGGGPGRLVGNGHLILRHLFGGGREVSLRLNRLPERVSSVDARVMDPFVAGLPFSVEGRFEGLQQDTTYGQQRYRAELGYRLAGELRLLGTLSREVTRPGPGGIALRQGRQRIPRADAWFYGLGIRYERVDQPVNPRRGLIVETQLEQGRKTRSLRVVTPEPDTTLERTRLRQERLRVRSRLFLPTFPRQVLALGGEAALLRSNAYDQSDLFRFGGATSLRGYDEERFRGRIVARALAEYRYQLDPRSYAFVFFDLGYVETPELVDLDGARGVHPGYGLGMQFSTALGLINASYAMSPADGPANGRVHVGLSLGL
ncbi:MAG: hypothetical protein D6685_15905 [Bacteroidetes bacterium]|nr:MAG: hypothetical protein D6685_15905 [Bacteroidota bacterium]